jgi:hypothetical protein
MPLYSHHQSLTLDSVHEQPHDEALISVSPVVKNYPLTTIPEYEIKTLSTIPERHVSFETTAQVFDVLPLQDYTQAEIENTWYGETFR